MEFSGIGSGKRDLSFLRNVDQARNHGDAGGSGKRKKEANQQFKTLDAHGNKKPGAEKATIWKASSSLAPLITTGRKRPTLGTRKSSVIV